MASNREFVEYVAEQMEAAGEISWRMMFGAYTVYCDGKVVGIVDDNQLFIKPTEAGRSFIGEVVEAPPYPGAKLCFLIENRLDDREWISELVSITARELPAPKPKKKKKEGLACAESAPRKKSAETPE